MLKTLIRSAFAVLIVLLAAAIAGGFRMHWTLDSRDLRERLIHRIEASTGLTVEANGPLTLVALPRPTLWLGDVHIEGAGHALDIRTRTLAARLDVAALLTGRLHVLGAALDHPVITADVDRLRAILGAMLKGEGSTLRSLLRTSSLAVNDAVVHLHSADPPFESTLSDVGADWHWPEHGTASFTGNGLWRGEHGAVVVAIDDPVTVLSGGRSAGYLHIRSSLVDLTATGELGASAAETAGGRIDAATHDLPRFLRLIGTRFPALDAIREARLGGDWTLPDGILDVRNARLALDDMLFEGDMAFHESNGHPGLSGTLATDRIALDPFLRAIPGPTAPDGSWNSAVLNTEALAFDDIDLRISATRASLGPIDFEDAGLSLQSGGGRLEFSLGEARSYDGLIKGRIVAQIEGDRTDVRAEANVSQVNLGALSRRFAPGPGLAGTSTAHLVIQATGDSPQALVASAAGEGEINVREGAVGSQLLGRMIKVQTTARGEAGWKGGRFAFDSATVDVDVDHGIARIAKGVLARDDRQFALTGAVSFPDQTIECMARSDPSKVADTPVMRLHGPWRALGLAEDADRDGAAARDR